MQKFCVIFYSKKQIPYFFYQKLISSVHRHSRIYCTIYTTLKYCVCLEKVPDYTCLMLNTYTWHLRLTLRIQYVRHSPESPWTHVTSGFPLTCKISSSNYRSKLIWPIVGTRTYYSMPGCISDILSTYKNIGNLSTP